MNKTPGRPLRRQAGSSHNAVEQFSVAPDSPRRLKMGPSFTLPPFQIPEVLQRHLKNRAAALLHPDSLIVDTFLTVPLESTRSAMSRSRRLPPSPAFSVTDLNRYSGPQAGIGRKALRAPASVHENTLVGLGYSKDQMAIVAAECPFRLVTGVGVRRRSRDRGHAGTRSNCYRPGSKSPTSNSNKSQSAATSFHGDWNHESFRLSQ